jgi:mRNA-degrading endonuclease toxin of MazEF toxin-antitoxin module
VTLVPYTTSLRGSRFEVKTSVGFLKPGAFDAQGLVTIPFAKLIRAIGQLKPHELVAVERAVCTRPSPSPAVLQWLSRTRLLLPLTRSS